MARLSLSLPHLARRSTAKWPPSTSGALPALLDALRPTVDRRFYVAVDQRNTRWCSDGLEIACDNGEKVRVAFALDCCDRQAMGHLATTGGITVEDVHDLMVATVEHRYGRVNRVPAPIEWLNDNGSCYVARATRTFARDIGLVPRTTPVGSPQSNGMAEAFVRTLKRDYVRVTPRPTRRPLSRSCQPGSLL